MQRSTRALETSLRVLGMAVAMQLAATASASAQAAATAPKGEQVEEVVVTGSRLATGFSSPTPVSVLGGERLEERAMPNIGDALNELPSFRATQTPAATGLVPTAGYVGGRILDLRGLGAVRTLTLVDGKRFVPSTTQATVDTNMIPSIMLKRAEVVTGGASAQYGSDAIAGVVNLILDKDFTGLKGNVQYGQSGEGDNQDYLASLAGGFAINDKVHVVIGGDYEKNRGVGDCQERDWCRTEALNFGRNPGDLSIPANNILLNIHPSTVPFNGVIVPTGYAGTQPVLGSPLSGISFSDAGVPRRFQYGTMVNSLYQVGGEGKGQNIYFKNLNIVAPTERYTAMTHIGWEVTPTIKAGLDVSYGHLKATYSSTAYRNVAIPIRRDNAFIPTSTDPALNVRGILDANPGIASFNLGRGFDDIGSGHITSTDGVFRTVVSLEGQLNDTWSWDGYYQYGRNSFRSSVPNSTITNKLLNAIDSINSGGRIVCRINTDAVTTNDDPGCVPFNPFGQTNGAAAKAYVTGTATQTNVTTEHVLAANLRGVLFNLPYGPVSVAGGGEYRSDQVDGDADALSKTLGFFANNGSLISGKINVAEAYLEGEVPILKGLPAANELSLNGAIRRTHYDRSSDFSASSSVDVTTWKIGAVYEPVEMIRLRATASRDIRAPNIAELFGPTTVASGILTDPARGGLQTTARVFSGSNPKLIPETAESFTVGIVLKPTSGFLSRFRASVDYYDIDITDAISTLGQQNIATRCFQGDPVSCGLITRDSTGLITQIVDVQQNVNELITRGVDVEISYRQPLGDYGTANLRLLGTFVNDLITVDALGPTERAGQTGLRAGTPSGIPDFTGDALLTWDYKALTVSGHVRYINEGFYNSAFIGAEQAGYAQSLSNSSNTNYVPSRTYVDLLAQYRLERGDSRSLTLYAGVDNIGDVDPPLIPGANGTGNNVLFSPIGRSFKTGLRFTY